MDVNNPKRDKLARHIFSYRYTIAPILQYALDEFKDVPLDEIAEKYLIIDEPKQGDHVLVEPSELLTPDVKVTQFDLPFYVTLPEQYPYLYLIGVEVDNSPENANLRLRRKTFKAKLQTREQNWLKSRRKENMEQGKEKKRQLNYTDYARTHLIEIRLNPPKSRANTIVDFISVTTPYKRSSHRESIGEYEGTVPLLPGEKDQMLEEKVTVFYVGTEADEEFTDIFKYIRNGLFGGGTYEERIEEIEKVAGPMNNNQAEILKNIWGTNEYYFDQGKQKGIQEGIQKGELKESRKNRQKLIDLMRRKGNSTDQINDFLVELDWEPI